ncbi:hypothetical protein LPTSP2_10460 [Leptospira ellinghausenii]|uniref:Uncharacterized protein n=1 Tax=Leptospira ellinghausenii TaxID=1917822 RepID=A0A2P2DAZ0_9LEPT|nr:hypothetical protein [Leptospira ellinghausenii]GBF41765.1 hypothetical protein LPTSP2_10460 [Leptospira ellinghausenii]
MIKKLSIFILALVSTSLFALEDIEKVLVQKANTPEEKKVVKSYLLKVAKEHKDLAAKYRGLAKAQKGGKAIYQDNRKAEMIDLAEKFESDAKVYEEEAGKL